MKRNLSLAAVLAMLLGACSSQPPGPGPGPSSCKKPVTANDFGDPTLIGGRPAKPEEWPSSIYPRSGNSACSSTVIGNRVVSSAAHCMPPGGTIRFTVGPNSYTARCTHHPEYQGGRNSTADWALCLVDKEVVGGPYENVMIGTVPVKVGEKVLLSGYGCTSPGGGGGNDGVFRIGESTVTRIPSGSGTNYDIVTKGGAALCFGDSGGALWYIDGKGNRFLIGNNSRGNIRDESYFSATGTATAAKFYRDWLAANPGAEICNVTPNAKGCRGGSGPTPPDPSDKVFVVENEVACVEGVMKKGYEQKVDAAASAVRDALDQLR